MKKLLFTLAALLMAGNAMADRVVTFEAGLDDFQTLDSYYDDDGMFLYDIWGMHAEGVSVYLSCYEELQEPVEDDCYIIKFGNGLKLDIQCDLSAGGIKKIELNGLAATGLVGIDNLYLADDAYGQYECIGNIGVYSCDNYTQSVQFYGGPAKIMSITVTLTDEVTPDPTQKTGSPTFNGYTTDGIHAYFVEIIPTEPSTIYYRVQYPDETWTDWAEYEEILAFTGNGKHRVEAYAVAPGKLPSEQIAYEFVVTYTGIEEMNAGKTVAGVRYYNMAGQEMSEANGLTIVVTTFTDGTTSTAKVIK